MLLGLRVREWLIQPTVPLFAQLAIKNQKFDPDF
jgi:hypothetical protein